MFIDAIERLYAYQRESNNHLFEVASKVPDHDLADSMIYGLPSIKETLFHMVEIIEVHFYWWSFAEDGVAPASNERNSKDFSDLESI